MWDCKMLCNIRENKEKERRSDPFLALLLVEIHDLRFSKPSNILPPVSLLAYGAFLPSRMAVKSGFLLHFLCRFTWFFSRQAQELPDFLILFFIEALLYCGIAIFLLIIDHVRRSAAFD